MAIVKTRVIYEVLFRFDETGTFKGSHTKYAEIIKDTVTGEIYASTETPPVAVAGADVSALMSQNLGNLAGRVTTLTAERDTLAKQVANLTRRTTAI